MVSLQIYLLACCRLALRRQLSRQHVASMGLAWPCHDLVRFPGALDAGFRISIGCSAVDICTVFAGIAAVTVALWQRGQRRRSLCRKRPPRIAVASATLAACCGEMHFDTGWCFYRNSALLPPLCLWHRYSFAWCWGAVILLTSWSPLR